MIELTIEDFIIKDVLMVLFGCFLVRTKRRGLDLKVTSSNSKLVITSLKFDTVKGDF